MKKIIVIALLVVLCLPFINQPVSSDQVQFKPRKYITENVIFLNTDGMRFVDGLGAKEKNLPHIWNDIRPNGIILTNCWNNTTTYTAPGHACCITGAWQYEPNNGRIRPTTPTMFEYYRRQFKAPPEDVCILPGKGNCWHLNYSTFPGFGREYSAPIYSLGDNDDKIVAKLKILMETTKPKLVYAILPEVDGVAHAGNYDKYTDAIKHADELIWDVWQTIQTSPDYKDKTTLVIATDHGRHKDGWMDGFKSHGDACEGCRHIFGVMIGPDIKKGLEIKTEELQVDFVPTIGQLMGFATSASDGKPLMEALVERPNKELPDEERSYIQALENECKYFLDNKYKALLPVALNAALLIPKEKLGHSLSDGIFLMGVLDASQKLENKTGFDYVKAWADGWISSGLKLDEISDASSGEVLMRLGEISKDDKYKTNAKKISDWIVGLPFGKSEKGAILSKPIRAPFISDKQVKMVKAENIYAIMPLLIHSQVNFGGDFGKFALDQWKAHKNHLQDGNGLFRHYQIIGVNEEVNPVYWVRGSAYALYALLESEVIAQGNNDILRQIDQLISSEKLGDELIDREQQNGLWLDDLAGQVSDYDTVGNCIIIAGISKWQATKFKKRAEGLQPLCISDFIWHDPNSVNAISPPKIQKESGLNSSMQHILGAWEIWKRIVSSSGLVFGSSEPADNIQRGYQGFNPPVYSKDRGFFIEGQGAFLSALSRTSTLAEKLGTLFFLTPPIK